MFVLSDTTLGKSTQYTLHVCETMYGQSCCNFIVLTYWTQMSL